MPMDTCEICGAELSFAHDHRPDNTGLDDGPPLRTPRKKMQPKPADETRAIRAQAWATRRERYGQKRKPQTEPTLDGLIAWLETQDPKSKYDYWDVDRCAIGQYLTSIGTSHAEQDRKDCRLILYWNSKIAASKTAAGETFGAALKRARRLHKWTP